MNKLFKKILCFLIAVTVIFSLTACQPDEPIDTTKINVIVPDGAPALSIAKLLSTGESFDEGVTYTITSSQKITTYITQKTADIAILPVTAASKIVGTGEIYSGIGVVTHGNLYIIGRNYEIEQKYSNHAVHCLKGKTIACIQPASVPGLTLKLILNKENISYTMASGENDYERPNANTVKIVPLTDPSGAKALLQQELVDYVLVSEPVASKIISDTALVQSNRYYYSLQNAYKEAYNTTESYPQAIVVVKNNLLNSKPEFVSKFITALRQNSDFIQGDISKVLSAVTGTNYLDEGLTPTYNENNLTSSVIENSNVEYKSIIDMKDIVNNYIMNIRNMNINAVGSFADEFFKR